jgi:HEAT repeat protein
VAEVRLRAVHTLAALGDRRALEPLREALVSDPDLELVTAIEGAIRRIDASDDDDDAGPAMMIEPVIELRDDPTDGPLR